MGIEKYLFVCSAGEDRSPTAALLAREIAKTRGKEIETHSLGLSVVLNNLEFKPEFDKYNNVFVMEPWMAGKIREVYGFKGEIECLDVYDVYEDNDRELERVMRRKLERIF